MKESKSEVRGRSPESEIPSPMSEVWTSYPGLETPDARTPDSGPRTRNSGLGRIFF